MEANLNKVLDKLSRLIFERDKAVYFEKPFLEAEYNAAIGMKRYEAFCYKMDSLKVIKRLELTKAFYSQGEISGLLEKEFSEWEIYARNMKKQIEDSAEIIAEIRSHDSIDDLLQKYRNSLVEVHPVLYPDLAPRFAGEWKKFESLCSEGKYDRAEKVFVAVEKSLEGEPRPVPDPAYVAETERQIEHEIEIIRAHFPFNIEDLLSQAEWIRERLDEIEEEIAESKNQIEFFSKKLEEMQSKVNRHS